MSFSDVPELPSATIFRCPAGLALPTVDPHALAVECALRFVGAHYMRRDAPLPVAVEIGRCPASSGDEKGAVRRNGVASCLQIIEANVPIDAGVLPEGQRPLAQCVKMMALRSLFPAFIYITHRDDGLFNNSIRKGIVPKVATVWQRLRGTYRSDVLERTTCCGRFSSIEEAFSEAEQCLCALEAMCAAANARTTGSFLLGTERPCSVDALVYAAASSFIHADFVGHRASPGVVCAQARIRKTCPCLTEYVERLRQLYFEEYSAFYTLRAVSGGESAEEFVNRSLETDIYQKGRGMTIMCTICFTLLYFALANVNLIVGMLEAVGDEYAEMEENEEEGEDSDTGKAKAS